MAKPDKIRIPLDEGRFENVGRLPDGRQFMAYVTGAFPTGMEFYRGTTGKQRRNGWPSSISSIPMETTLGATPDSEDST